ncbi:MAG TPA: ribosome recycling factor [Steroidobacteraceae bacterium]|jgi:ribosome recycling factor|nr:ribosome recycling factor [Steroidobacteraceae bacterium]
MDEAMSRDATQRMGKCVALLRDHYRKMRTGRANVGLLDGLKVDYYGSEVPINQVASVSVEDARTLVVSPWDKSAVSAVEKAILKSDLGLTPNTAGQVIRLPLPPMTEERRKELTKVARHEAESARVAVRAVRHDLMNELKEMLKERLISEDENRRGQEEIQKLTDRHVHDIDQVLAEKEKELLQV